jgi:hypothetical protein
MEEAEFTPRSLGSNSRKAVGSKSTLKKAQSDLSTQKSNNVNVVSINDLFGKNTFGAVSSPVIDMASSFGSAGSFLSDEFNFKSDNPIYVPFNEFGDPLDEEKPFRTGTQVSRNTGSAAPRGRWTLTSLSFFKRKSDNF